MFILPNFVILDYDPYDEQITHQWLMPSKSPKRGIYENRN